MIVPHKSTQRLRSSRLLHLLDPDSALSVSVGIGQHDGVSHIVELDSTVLVVAIVMGLPDV